MAQLAPKPRVRCMAFSVIVTHPDPDRAGEVAEAFAKLTIFMADALGGRGMSSPIQPYYHLDRPPAPEDRPVGYRFGATVRGENAAHACTIAQEIRENLAAAGAEDGKGCNFTVGEAMPVGDSFAEELAAKLGR